MKKNEYVVVLLSVLMVIVTMIAISLMSGCTLRWSKPDDGGLTVEQKGVLVKLTAKNALIQAWREEPGEWKDHVCSIATLIFEALDGDEAAIAQVNDMLAAPLQIAVTEQTITIGTKDLLFALLQHSAQSWNLDGWESPILDGITLADAFLISGITTEYEVWYLTREFFAGVGDGCQMIGDE